jgi:hypothetical protein
VFKENEMMDAMLVLGIQIEKYLLVRDKFLVTYGREPIMFTVFNGESKTHGRVCGVPVYSSASPVYRKDALFYKKGFLYAVGAFENEIASIKIEIEDKPVAIIPRTVSRSGEAYFSNKYGVTGLYGGGDLALNTISIVEDKEAGKSAWPINNDADVQFKAEHQHDWKQYTGLVEQYEYCDCGEKKV